MAADPLANWTPVAPAGGQDSIAPDPLANWRPLGDGGQSSGGYPDMTPGPPQPKLTDTSFRTLPSDTRAGVVHDDAPTRIRTAVKEAWDNGNPITPDYQTKMNAAPGPFGWVNRNIVNPALGTVGGGVGAAGAAVGSTLGELADQVAPGARRDVSALLQTVPPMAMAAAPLRVGALTEAPPAGPRVAPAALDLTDAEARARVRAATAPPGVPTGGPATDTGIPGPMPPPPGYQAPFSAPATAKAAFTGAKEQYAKADALGGAINDNANSKFVTQLAKDNPPDTQVQTFNRGPTLVDQTVTDFQNAMNGQNLSLSTFQGIDKSLGDRIQTALNQGNNNQASALMSMRNALRDHVENAGPSDTVGGNAAGFAALSDARQAWQTAVKMQDVERMRANAELAAQTGGSATQAFQSQVRSFLRNDDNTRGWTQPEKDALLGAARTGTYDEIYRTLGSRLIPIGSAVGAGPVAGLAVGAAQSVASTALREALAKRMLGRVQDTLGVIGQGYPRSTVAPGTAIRPPVQTIPSVGLAGGLLGSAAFPPNANTAAPPSLLRVPPNYQPPQM